MSSMTEDVVQPPERDLAYLAGILDGEGCFSIGKSSKGYYNLRVDVVNTDRRLIEWLHVNFGGYTGDRNTEKVEWKNKQTWSNFVCCRFMPFHSHGIALLVTQERSGSIIIGCSRV